MEKDLTQEIDENKITKQAELVVSGNGIATYDVVTFLKGFSIITIVLMHYFQRGFLFGIVEKALSIGGTGVHVFFFCSGFGLFMLYTKRKTDYLEFLKKRFLKIYIPYIIVASICFLLPLSLKTEPLKTFLAHAFLYKMFMPLYEKTLTAAFWYMSTLFQFYFLFIPLARAEEKIENKKFLISTCDLSMAWWIFTTVTGLNSERVWGVSSFSIYGSSLLE